MNAQTSQPVSSMPGPEQTPARGAAVPVWMFIMMMLLLFWGAVYFDDNGGWFNSKVYAPYHSIEEVQSFQVSGGGDPFAAGRLVYGKTCIACHQANGQGMPGQFPPLVASDWVNEKEPGRIIRAVLNGMSGPITVKGQNFNNTMVPWGGILSDDDIAAVISYVRGNKEWNNNASPVTPAQVHAIREKLKAHPTPFSPDELLKISPSE